MSSPAENAVLARELLAKPSPVRFGARDAHKYIISDFQQIYFVIESFEQLLHDCDRDFGRCTIVCATRRT